MVTTLESMCARLPSSGAKLSVCELLAEVNRTVSLCARHPTCGVRLREYEWTVVVNSNGSLSKSQWSTDVVNMTKCVRTSTSLWSACVVRITEDFGLHRKRTSAFGFVLEY